MIVTFSPDAVQGMQYIAIVAGAILCVMVVMALLRD